MSAATCPEHETPAAAVVGGKAAPGAPAQRSGPPPCPKCGSTASWGRASWCPTCGYYPALGTVVDEKPQAMQPQAEEKIDLWKAIPTWVKITALGAAGVALLNVAVGLALPFGSDGRFLFAVTEFGLSLTVAFSLHLKAIFYALPRSEKIGPFDLFFNPFRLWRPTYQALPRTWKRVCLLAWMVVAAKCAMLLNGGTDFSRLWEEDWGVERRAQENLVHAIVQQARKADGSQAESLDDAMKQFAGDEELEAEDDVPDAEESADCLIVGYTKESDGTIGSLVLASAPFGRLKYVGRVSGRVIPKEQHADLIARMESIRRERPIVRCQGGGQWLQPQMMCRVTLSKWTEGGELVKASFKEMLADVDTRK